MLDPKSENTASRERPSARDDVGPTLSIRTCEDEITLVSADRCSAAREPMPQRSKADAHDLGSVAWRARRDGHRRADGQERTTALAAWNHARALRDNLRSRNQCSHDCAAQSLLRASRGANPTRRIRSVRARGDAECLAECIIGMTSSSDYESIHIAICRVSRIRKHFGGASTLASPQPSLKGSLVLVGRYRTR